MTIQRISETKILDQKGEKVTIRPGDSVELIPFPRGEDHFEYVGPGENHDSLKRFLGEGPYRIAWMGRWPCGRDMLYFDIEGGQPGAHASDFRYVGTV